MTILRFDEEMTGVTADGRKLHFRLHVEAKRVRRMLLAQTMDLRGEVDFERVCKGASLEGTLIVGKPWQRVMRYELAFRGDDGARYRFVGKKNVRWLSPRESLTTLGGEITRDGEDYTTATVTFRWADLPEFLRSFRLERSLG
jgi:hypothetical protein